MYWYRRGAELGHGGCQYNLARCLWYGIGTQADHQQALLWCRRAAAAGVEVAKSVLPQWEREAGAVHSDSPAQPPPRGNPPSSPAHSEKDRVVLMLGWVCMALYGLFLIVGTVNNNNRLFILCRHHLKAACLPCGFQHSVDCITM